MSIKIILALFFGVVLFFQNCSSENTQSMDSQFQESAVTNPNKTLGETNGVDFITIERDSVRVKFELVSGEIAEVSDPNLETSMVNFCFKTERLENLRALIENSDVCLFNNEVPPDMLCSQALVPPYLHLENTSNGVVYRLGEASDGCRKKVVDLCDGSERLLSEVNGVDFNNDIESCK